MKRLISNQLGRKGFPFKKKFCIVLLFMFFVPAAYFAGYGTLYTSIWLKSSPCDRAEIGDLNPFKYKNPDALSDKELACLIVNSNFDASEYEWVFKTIYCESSKKPHEVKVVNGVAHHGLSMISDLNFKMLGVSNHRILYDAEKNLLYMHKLHRIRGRQPWETDSSKEACMDNGPHMDGAEENGTMIRDGWAWAEPTFDLYFGSSFEKIYNHLLASID